MKQPLQLHSFAASLLCVAAPVFAGHSPTITTLSDSELTRSGRLLLFGSDFGTAGAGSEVLIDGLPAIATTWLDGEIHAYVPEAASLGAVDVQVVTPTGASPTVSLNVTTRAGTDPVRWQFQLDSDYAGRSIAVGPNGDLYVTDEQRLYALSSDGGLMWVVADAGSEGSVSVAPDGTIYTWSNGIQGLVAVDPSGNVLWTFPTPNPLQPALMGPNVGPDGNIYVGQDSFNGGLGVFSVDPSGSLRWADPASPSIANFGGAGNTDIEFPGLSADRLVFGNSPNVQGLPPLLYGFDLDGDQQWTYSSSCNTFPRIDPMGRVVFARNGTCGITLLDPADGSVVWNAPPPQSIVSTVRAAAGPDGTIFSGDFVGKLWAVNPDGSTKWFVDAPFVVSRIGVTPDAATLLEGQADVHAFATADGSLLWSFDPPMEQGFTQIVNTASPAFSSDSATGYLTTRFTGDGPGYSYVYAFALGDAPEPFVTYCTAKVNSSGCTPAIGASGTPSLSSPSSFDVTAQMVLNQKNGLFFYGTNGRSALPFLGGTLCAAPPLRRGPVTGSGGTPPPQDCSGAYAFDFNDWAQGGNDPALTAGTTVDGQFWSRDPQQADGTGAGLTDAVEFTLGL